MSEENKTIVRRVLEEVFSKGNMEVARELVSPGYTDLTENVHNLEEIIQQIQMYRSAFPDLTAVVLDQVAEGDRVATRYLVRGTHQGEFMGIAPTDKKMELTAMSIDRIEDGKVVEAWGNWDALGLLQQLGVIPPMGD